jgi:hypothetical protein
MCQKIGRHPTVREVGRPSGRARRRLGREAEAVYQRASGCRRHDALRRSRIWSSRSRAPPPGAAAKANTTVSIERLRS